MTSPSEPQLLSSATPWSSTLAVFDLETTGIDTSTSRIVTANVSAINSTGAVIERADWLVNPGIDIPEQASAVHGITTEYASANGVDPATAVAEISSLLADYLDRGVSLVIYNAPYDLSLLQSEAVRHGVTPLIAPAPIVDPLVIDKAVDRYRKGKRTLVATAIEYGVLLEDAHDAGADAIAAGRVAQAIARRHADALNFSARELHERQIVWFREQALSFQEYMRRVKDPEFVARTAWPREQP